MIPQLGFAELLIIAILALVVVGPQDLPKMMRTLGRFIRRIKMMGQEFKDAFSEIGADEEMEELRREIEDLKALGQFSVDDIEDEMRALDDDLRGAIDPNATSSVEGDNDG